MLAPPAKGVNGAVRPGWSTRLEPRRVSRNGTLNALGALRHLVSQEPTRNLSQTSRE